MEENPRQLSLTPDDALALLRREAEALLAQPGRRVLGIAGGPGTGKSTIAQKLAAELGPAATYVPMVAFRPDVEKPGLVLPSVKAPYDWPTDAQPRGSRASR